MPCFCSLGFKILSYVFPPRSHHYFCSFFRSSSSSCSLSAMAIVWGVLLAVALAMLCAVVIAESLIEDYRRDRKASRSEKVEETESSAVETQEERALDEELRKLGFVSERCAVDESVGEAATALAEEAFRTAEEVIAVPDFVVDDGDDDEFGDRLAEQLESMEEDYGYDDYDDDDDDDDSVFDDRLEQQSEQVEENFDEDDDVLGDGLEQQSEPMEENEEEVKRSDESRGDVVSEEKFVDEKAETLVSNDIRLEVVKTDEVIDERIAKKDEHVDVVKPSEETSSEIRATSDGRIAKEDQHVDVVEPSEVKSSEIMATSEEMSSEIREKEIEIAEKEGLLVDDNDDDDDWEGIERSGIEKRFDAAVKFVEDNSDCLSKLEGNVRMQLYALCKAAIEGPCYEPSPMALMVSARAKCYSLLRKLDPLETLENLGREVFDEEDMNAWRKLGNMSPAVAMEQYISILSEGIPGWEGEKSDKYCDRDKINASLEIGKPGTQVHGNFPRIDESHSTFEGVGDAIEVVKNS
ncbi:hypothetical protein Scep_001122 [Stephania cephalantha]|uniref:ACB domain-containing protein n=1 Tax=Stephania cephalantha TaxID=152367 RepID=A0AAP0L7T8_9MAGN